MGSVTYRCTTCKKGFATGEEADRCAESHRPPMTRAHEVDLFLIGRGSASSLLEEYHAFLSERGISPRERTREASRKAFAEELVSDMDTNYSIDELAEALARLIETARRDKAATREEQ